MRPKDELKKWITDTKNEVLDSENNYMFFLVPPDTVESILVLFDEFMKYLESEQDSKEWIISQKNLTKFGTILLRCPLCDGCVACCVLDIPVACGHCGEKLRNPLERGDKNNGTDEYI